VDIARYSKDEFKRVLAELVKYEEFVTELTVSKTIRGGKLPARVYNIIIMEPDAVNLKEIEKMKKDQMRQKVAPDMKAFKEAVDGVPKK